MVRKCESVFYEKNGFFIFFLENIVFEFRFAFERDARLSFAFQRTERFFMARRAGTLCRYAAGIESHSAETRLFERRNQAFAKRQRLYRAVRERLNFVRENEILYVFEKKQSVHSIWTETEDDLLSE